MRVLAEFPDSAMAHAMLAMALADQGRGRDALFSADFAVARDPNLALAHAARACALETMGMTWEAEMESRQAVALAPTDPIATRIWPASSAAPAGTRKRSRSRAAGRR